MCIVFGQDVDEFLEIIDTSTSKKLKQLVVAVMRLYNVGKMLSLPPRDTADSSKFIDKRSIRINTIQQLNTIDRQLANPRFV